VARIRSIHPGLWTDEAFLSIDDAARLLYIGLLNEADDNGAFEWKPLTIKVRLRPATSETPAEIATIMEKLCAANMIRRYDHDGKIFGAVRNFVRYQRPKSPKSVHPIPEVVREFVGLNADGSRPRSETGRPPNDDEEKPLPNPPETPAETSPQREEGGGKREEERATQPLAKPSEEDPLPDPERVVTAEENRAENHSGRAGFGAVTSDDDLGLPSFLDRSLPPSRKAELDDIERQLREAAGLENDPSPGLLDLSPIIGLLDANYRLAEDVLTIIRARARPGVKTWRYFVPAIEQAKRANQAIAPKPAEPVVAAVVWIHNEQAEWAAVSARWQREKGKPPPVMGSRNGRIGQGHYFPADWLSAQPERTEA